jgi:hypothetical protein
MLSRTQQHRTVHQLSLALSVVFIALIACTTSQASTLLPTVTATTPAGTPARTFLPTKLSFSADHTLTATTDLPVDNTGYFIEIDNVSTGSLKNQCSSGTVCSKQLANSDAQATYQAFVKNTNSTLLISNSVTVTWGAPPPRPTDTPIRVFPNPTPSPLPIFPTVTPTSTVVAPFPPTPTNPR